MAKIVAAEGSHVRRKALRFILVIGIVSLFADFTYEGSRSITGQFLGSLGASGTLIGVVAGLGELLGYGLRIVSGRLSDKTQQFWPITLCGYLVQMAAVPLLALAGNLKAAVFLILAERIGKAVRNPPRDVMISHAAQEIGYGWGFGVHEALDQCGALIGPLVVALILASHRDFRLAFAALLIPATLTYSVLLVARFLYPHPERMERLEVKQSTSDRLPPVFWLYLSGACLVAAAFADFQLIAYHFSQVAGAENTWIPVSYAIAMGVSGFGSLVFGKLFDRIGIAILLPLTIVSALFAPLVFYGHFSAVIVGSALWGLGMGVHESIIPAAIATIVPREKRASAYGIFTGLYGVSWFAGSAIMGVLYDRSKGALVAFCLILQLLALPIFVRVKGKVNLQNQLGSV